MAAVAFEAALDFQHGLRVAANQPAAFEESRLAERELAGDGEIEPWELHSELVLVCPEVHKRALELLPERDPDAFLTRPLGPVLVAVDPPAQAEMAGNLAAALLAYTLWRLAETARCGLIAVGAVVALALFAELPH
jgi:hypothetical protein